MAKEDVVDECREGCKLRCLHVIEMPDGKVWMGLGGVGEVDPLADSPMKEKDD